MNLSENNCTDCKKYVKPKNGKIMLTVVIFKTEQVIQYLCEKCLTKMKELTKDDKVAIEVDPTGIDPDVLYCYRCELKTKDKEIFKRHNCIKTQQTLKFAKSLMENDGR